MKKLLSILILFALSLSGLMAGVKEASQNFKDTKELADKGDAKAQCELAVLYLRGKEVAKDNEMAVAYFEKSAEQGYASAQCYLGGFYMKGSAGMKKDDQKAFEYHTKAAAQNYANAQYKLGLHYLLNEENPSKAFELFENAAKQSQAHAQYELAMLYMEGKGVAKDEEEGLKWMKKSADAGNKKAKEFLKKAKGVEITMDGLWILDCLKTKVG